MAKEALNSNTLTKEVLNANSFTKDVLSANSLTKEPLPQNTGRGGFGHVVFGRARFGEVIGVRYPKESLPANSFSKEALTSLIT